jgi:propanol-preferring alcohol dehydrogenase
VRAVVLDAFGERLRLEERPEPRAEHDDQAVVRVLASGVCHSDLHVAEGYFSTTPLPIVLGHEIAGEIGGERVLIYTPWGCGNCRWCDAGEEMICPDSRECGMLQDGGYADYLLVPSKRYLFPLGDLDPPQAAPLGCGGLTAFRAVKHARPWLRHGARILVLGAGGLGQFAIQFIRLLSDAAVWAGDVSGQKQARALELGAEVAAAPDELEGPVDVVLDFVASNETLATAARLVDRKGLVAAVGLFEGRIPFGLGAVPHEAHFMSSIWGSLDDLRELIELAQREPLEYTIETLSLEQAQEAHDRLRRGEAAGRLVLVP